jgi:hypothetical protein
VRVLYTNGTNIKVMQIHGHCLSFLLLPSAYYILIFVCANVDSTGTSYHNNDIIITLAVMAFNVNFVLPNFILGL